ncbi:Lon, substrate-binding domain containing protein [Burkholderiaceae bacterium]
MPLFPLQTVLFPGGHLPLQIFEVRYLEMIGRCQQEQAPFGVVALAEGREVRTPSGSAARLEPVGTLAHLQQFDKVQPALWRIQCQGRQRFRVLSSEQKPNGLWVADIEVLTPDPWVSVPPDLTAAQTSLQAVLQSMQEQAPEVLADWPLQPPFAWTDSGWLANRWAELLPLPLATRQQLMSLDNPLLRLELVCDLLEQHGVNG